MPSADTPPSDGAEVCGAPCPIVGIGSSAGGIEALTALIKTFALDSMAFVVMQHVAPDHDSMLPAILGRTTKMTVVHITDGLRIEPNHVYVAPPNANVALLHGVLHLMSPVAPMPIDLFFRSLAEDQGAKAIGVVLSGMGTDGTQGLREIKARGGLAFCQDPSTAKYDSMPQSALESGVVDLTLSPEGIGNELMTISKHPYLARRATDTSPASEREDMGRLFILLRSAFGNDLSFYKPNTIGRRVERRMALHRIERLADYVRYVQETREELSALYRDVLIGVTSFFRDKEPFELVKTLVYPRILERKAPGSTIRIWVPACASGEEAYSLGICLLEVLDQTASRYRIQIFGTDADAAAIARARRGVYPSNIEADVSPERLERFFVKVGKEYQVTRRLRDVLVFSEHNLARDAPFSRIDLASCRNILIYLQAPLQKKVLRLLHYALNPDGYLLLGTSETVGDCADVFSLVDRKNKIYIRKNLPLPPSLDARAGFSTDEEFLPKAPESEKHGGQSARQLADRALIERYGPASVLVDEAFEVLQFRGDTGAYLSPASGNATLNVLKLLRPELHVEVWRAMQHVLKTNAATRVPPIRLPGREGETQRTVGIEVLPIHDRETQSRCMLIVFDESPAALTAPEQPSSGGENMEDENMVRLRALEQDLASTKEYLQATIEELEAGNEELKSTNEELQSTNEELQSTNEELETSKEELQSTNEELSTMNDELQNRMHDLSRSNADLENLLRCMEQPVLFVDGKMRLRLASESARRLLQLEPSDMERSLAQLQSLFQGGVVERVVRSTAEHLVPAIDRVQVKHRWYELRATPYRTPSGAVEGALVVLRDVDAEVRQKELSIDVQAYADSLLAAMPEPLAILDKQLRVVWVNKPFLQTFQVDAHATLGNLIQNLGSGQWAHPKLRAAMESALATGEPFRGFSVQHEFERIGRRTMKVSGSAISGVGLDRVLLLTITPVDGPPP